MKLKLLVVSILVVLGLVAYKQYHDFSILKSINSYDSCSAAKGSVIQTSYPATCVTRLGTRFSQFQITPWEKVEKYILAGEVKLIDISNNNRMSLLLKSGQLLYAIEPEINSLSKATYLCGGTCKDMQLRNE